MGSPLRKTRLVANDMQPPALVSASVPALLPLPLQKPVPRVMPYVRLAPSQPHRPKSSLAAVLSVFLLGLIIFMFGVVAGTVFWFTYDSPNIPEPVSGSPVMARLATPIQETAPETAPLQPVAPAGIFLSTENMPVISPPPASSTLAPAPPATNTDGMQITVHDGEATDIDAMLENARTRLERGDNNVAIVLYERVLLEEPENRVAQEGKAYALGRSGRYQAAATILRNLLKSDPQDTGARTSLVAMLGASSAPEALTELRRMAEATPDDAAVQMTLAKALAVNGKTSDAIEHLDRLLRRSPADVSARFDLAVLYDRMGQGPQALALYRQILQLAGDDVAELPPAMLDAVRRRSDYLGSLQ